MALEGQATTEKALFIIKQHAECFLLSPASITALLLTGQGPVDYLPPPTAPWATTGLDRRPCLCDLILTPSLLSQV